MLRVLDVVEEGVTTLRLRKAPSKGSSTKTPGARATIDLVVEMARAFDFSQEQTVRMTVQ